MDKDQVLELLDDLMISQELVDSSVVSLSAPNFDDTDKELANQIMDIVDLTRGVGIKPKSDFAEFATTSFGLSLTNAQGFAMHVLKQLEEHPEKIKKLRGVITKRVLKVLDLLHSNTPVGEADVTELVKERLLECSDETFFVMWALYLGGIKGGMTLGWRSHEFALLKKAGHDPDDFLVREDKEEEEAELEVK